MDSAVMADQCMMCGKTEPEKGWHTVGAYDGDMEFFCSAQCFNNSCDYSGNDEEEYDISEDCGRWSNGRLSNQCSKAGSEECDWECPIGLPRS
jgi:hypothetical protein